MSNNANLKHDALWSPLTFTFSALPFRCAIKTVHQSESLELQYERPVEKKVLYIPLEGNSCNSRSELLNYEFVHDPDHRSPASED